MSAKNVTKIPTGVEFLKLLQKLEDDCLARSTTQLPDLGKTAPNTMEHLGTVLSFLDRLASCHWGCKGGDHVAEALERVRKLEAWQKLKFA